MLEFDPDWSLSGSTIILHNITCGVAILVSMMFIGLKACRHNLTSGRNALYLPQTPKGSPPKWQFNFFDALQGMDSTSSSCSKWAIYA